MKDYTVIRRGAERDRHFVRAATPHLAMETAAKYAHVPLNFERRESAPVEIGGVSYETTIEVSQFGRHVDTWHIHEGRAVAPGKPLRDLPVTQTLTPEQLAAL